jgi:peptidyl-prolyl cis-trans isomerase D
VRNVRAAELARAEGQKKLTDWKASPASASLGAVLVVSRDQPHDLPPALLDKVMRTDTSELPVLVGVDLGAQGYAVARINKRMARKPATDDARQRDRAQYAQWWSQAESLAFYQLLQARFKVQMKVPNPAMSLPAVDARVGS